MNVTASISTKNRYTTTLPLTIESIVNQTVPPKQLVIYDDGEFKDLRGISPFSHLFPMLMNKGIQWYHLPGGRKGQVFNHQTTLDQCDTEFIWRMDDDNCPEPNCLERLLEEIKKSPDVGAVGGLVIAPNCQSPRPSFLTGKIDDIYCPFNMQWYRWMGPVEDVDHLYSTFLYRTEAGRKAGGYQRDLSPVGHREETMFSYSIKRAGYKLKVTPLALTWHLRESTGGIRSFNDPNLWGHDEQIFAKKLVEWGVSPKEYFFVVLDNGIGDHFIFKSILPELLEKNKNKKVVVSACYPEVFEDIQDITLASIGDARAAFGDLDQWSIYRWCDANNWKRPLHEAFRIMYGLAK